MRIISLVRSSVFALLLLAMSAAAYAQISISVSFAPPELPVYEQPLCPGEGYLWTPGYWAYANDYDDYYWVPGTWVEPPQVGLLWTPAYWGWGGNSFVFYDGYWGQQVGFYGGINYGYGYSGEGFEGGRWDHDRFFYNQSVSNVNVTVIHNVYNTTVINRTVNRVSYNGGNGGVSVRPRPEEEAAAKERHIPAVAAQTQHAQAARSNPQQRASTNHGAPPVAATPKAGALGDRAAVPAKPAATPYNREPNRPAALPAANVPAARPENNAHTDRPMPANPPETNRTEQNRQEPNRPAIAEPNNRVDRPETKRNEPAERPATPPPSERAQPERTAPAVTPQAKKEEPSKPQARVAENKHQEDQPKHEEKPQQ
jgi:hypothetical protein